MQRYFISKNQINDHLIKIEGSDVHHMRNVMRFSIGNQVIANTNEGEVFLTKITEIDKNYVMLEIIAKEPTQKLGYWLDLGLALTKRDAFELALKKVTELGVHGLVPLTSEFSIIKVNDYDKKRERYMSICKESSEQSERHTLPQIYDLVSLKDIDVSGYDHLFFAYAREEGNSIYDYIQTINSDDKTLVLIGPEGGFSKKEYQLLVKKGFKSISLGSTILRAETAAMYVASAFRLVVSK